MTADVWAAEWANTDEWRAMLGRLSGSDGSRRLRLWAVAICRHILDRHAKEPISPDKYYCWFDGLAEPARCLADAAELFADGHIRQHELTTKLPESGGPYNVFHAPAWKSRLTTEWLRINYQSFTREFGVPTHREMANLLRDIFGNPFRPVAFDPAWRSEAVVALARAAYESRNFTLLPILADALEEAGCDHPDVLAHCRGPGPHVRGCWVVDGVLGKG